MIVNVEIILSLQADFGFFFNQNFREGTTLKKILVECSHTKVGKTD